MTDALPPGLAELRDEIDAVDQELVRLFNQRASIAQKVAETKRVAGQGDQCYRPGREAQVLERARQRSEGPLAPDTTARLMREVMSACLALEQQLSVAYLGPEGTYTQAATLKHFGGSVKTVPLTSIDEVFRAVASGSSDYAVVPVENSVEGAVNSTMDALAGCAVSVCGEVLLRIRHNLLGLDQGDSATRVCAHPQALAQCRGWLDRHRPELERIAVSSNAEAARLASTDSTQLAVAGAEAAALYKLNIIEADIEDDPSNTTRFLVLGRHPSEPSGDDKTSLLFSTTNEAGSLHSALEVFARQGVSMSRIESRPARKIGAQWEYVFFVDVAGHAEQEPITSALKELSARVPELRVLGSYPRASLA